MPSTACADIADFRTDSGGRLQLSPHYLQTPLQTFTRTLTGLAGVYAELPDIAPLIVPAGLGGIWVVNWEMHGNAFITLAGAGTAVVATVMGGLGLNNALVGGSETMLSRLDQKAPTTAQPPLEVHGTGAGSRVLTLAAGDELSLFAARTSDAGTTSEIISSVQGRTRLTAYRIGGI